MECGVKVIVQNGRAIRVEGDEGAWQSMGNCCTKSQSSIQAAYHPDRLHYPMKRTNPKGEEPGWVRISWDEALDTIVDNLREITNKYGGESIACQVGTSRIWCMHSESILKNMLETPNNIEAWQICKGPRHFAGTMVSGLRLLLDGDHRAPKVYVQWGGASEMSNYDDSCRTTGRRGEPRRRAHLRRPPHGQHGQGGRLLAAPASPDRWRAGPRLTNVVIENNLYDDLYVKKWTNAPFLVCEDFDDAWMDENGFPTIRTDGSYWGR